jgi:hypothetical protein
MSLLTELGFVLGGKLQRCRAYGAGIPANPICQPLIFPVATPLGQE